MAIKKYRKKPVVIEAVQWDGKNWWDIHAWAGGMIKNFGEGVLKVKTLEGTVIAVVGDWLIKGTAGEFYPCKNDIFEATYEEAFVVIMDTEEAERQIALEEKLFKKREEDELY